LTIYTDTVLALTVTAQRLEMVASADSGDLFCNHLFEMLDVLAVEVSADPLDEFHFAQGAIQFNDGALGVDPLASDQHTLGAS
jgi:hypothetical protein